MQASNPLVAVGISAVVILGTTSAVSAQVEPPADANSENSNATNFKERSSAESDSQLDRTKATEAERTGNLSLENSVTSEQIFSKNTSSESTSTRSSQINQAEAHQAEAHPSSARIEIFVAPESASSAIFAVHPKPSLPQTSIASASASTHLGTRNLVGTIEASEPLLSQLNSVETIEEETIEEPEATEEPETVEAPEESEEPVAPVESSQNSESSEEVTEPDTTTSDSEQPDPPNEPADLENIQTPQHEASEDVAPDSDVTQEPETLEDTTPELTPEAVESEPNGNVSPEVTDETTEELEQAGEEAEEEFEGEVEETVSPDDEPPQDVEGETVLPSDGEPAELPSDELPPDSTPDSTPEPPATEDNQIQPSAPPDDDLTDSNSAPEYLDTDANPLLFPTTPEEVELLGTQPITLEQAIEAGLRNNEELQITRLQLQQQRAALREAQAEEYPDINANVGLNYNSQEQPREGIETITTTTGTQEIPTGEVDGTTASRSLALGGEISLSYPIYTSGRRPALIESAERQVRFQELQVEADTEDLILQITNDYYNLQEADEQVQIFRATLEEAERSLRDAEALERAGVGTRFDVLQAQVDVANALQNLRSQESQQEIARRQLAERLNLNQTLTLAAADPIEVAGVWELSLEETIVAAYRNRAELEQQLVQREIAERTRRAALAQLGPQVSFTTSYGLNNTLASDPDSLNEDAGFLSSFSAGLGLNMILFDGGAARAQARQAEANIAIAESNFANQRDQIRFNVEQSYAELQSNFENIQTTALAVQQAVEALRLARLRFQAGVGTQTDVLQAQTALTQARFNNLQAILDYNRALASLQRQVSNYPEGYLNEVP